MPLRSLLICCALSGVAVAGEVDADWPLYRVALEAEALRTALEEPSVFPWAKEINDRIGHQAPRERSIELQKQLSRIEGFERLASLRWHVRMAGPEAVPTWVEGNRAFSQDVCEATWRAPDPDTRGLHTAIATWSDRPPCLLQVFPTDPGWGRGKRPSVLSARPIAEGHALRVAAPGGRKEGSFRALYGADATLQSAQVRLDNGWGLVTREANGNTLVEQPTHLRGDGSPIRATARLAYAAPLANGAATLDLGEIDAPPRPDVPAAIVPVHPAPEALKTALMCSVFPEGPTFFEPDGDLVGPSTPERTVTGRWVLGDDELVVHADVKRNGKAALWDRTLTGLRAWRRGDLVFLGGRNGVFACLLKGLQPTGIPDYPWVLVQDAGAGADAVKTVREVVTLTIAATFEQEPDEVLVVSTTRGVASADHLAISYNDAQWAPVAQQIAASLRLAMPWQHVVVRSWRAADAPITIDVGW